MNHKLSCHRSRLPGKFVRVIVARHTHGWLFDHERKIRMHNSIEIENFALNRDCLAFFGQENPFPTRLLLWSFTLMFWYCWLVQGDISRCELYLHLPIFVFFFDISNFLLTFCIQMVLLKEWIHFCTENLWIQLPLEYENLFSYKIRRFLSDPIDVPNSPASSLTFWQIIDFPNVNIISWGIRLSWSRVILSIDDLF